MASTDMGLLDTAEAKLRGLLGYIEANTPRSTRPVAKPSTVINEGLINPNKYNATAANRFKDSAFGLLGVVPGVGDYASAAESADLFNRGENFAGGMAALGALPLVPAIGGMFIGKGAKTWDALKAQQAEELLAKGVDPREVWKQTGTMRGVDKALRQEIPDNAARMVDPDTTPGLLDKMIAADPSSKGLKGIPQAMALEDVLRHPELDRAYFNVREDAPSVMFDSLGSTRGNYSDGFVTLNNANILDAEPAQRSTMLHELQHAIQQREGWARGGSPEQFARGKGVAIDPMIAGTALDIAEKAKQWGISVDDIAAKPPKYWQGLDPQIWQLAKARGDDIAGLRKEFEFGQQAYNPEEAYRRLAGEAEARLTQARMNMNMDERLASYPYDMLDVPQDQLIVRGLLDGPAMSYADEAAQKGNAGLLGVGDNVGMKVPDLQKQLAQIEAKYEPLRKRGLFESPEWQAVGKEAAAVRTKLHELTGDWYGKPKVKVTRPSDDLLNGVYGSPDEVPKAVKQWVQQNSSLLTSDATDAVRWGRISGTLKDERYPDEPITLYRAVADGDEIRPGDWVTTSYEYAQDHLRKSLGGKGRILEESANGRDVLVSPTGNAEEAIFAPRKYSK